MKRTFVIYCLAFSVALLSCKPKANPVAVTEGESNEDKITYVNLYADIAKNDADGIELNDIAKSVRFIPLESAEKALLGGEYLQARRVGDYLFVSSGRGGQLMLKQFDMAGNLVGNVFTHGNGPQELTMAFNWVANENIKTVAVSGQYKMLSYDVESGELTDVKFPSIPIEYTVLNNGNYAVTVGYTPNDNEQPFINVYDKAGEPAGAISYNEPRDVYYKAIPNVTGSPMENYGIYQTNYGGVFRDMFNDTLYSVDLHSKLVPQIVIDRGELKPTIGEVHDSTQEKARKIYLRNIVDSDDFLMLLYLQHGEEITAVWDKRVDRLVARNSIASDIKRKNFGTVSHCNLYYSFNDGSKILIPIDCITGDNKVYVPLNALALSGHIDAVSEDDNVVIMEIELK